MTQMPTKRHMKRLPCNNAQYRQGTRVVVLGDFGLMTSQLLAAASYNTATFSLFSVVTRVYVISDQQSVTFLYRFLIEGGTSGNRSVPSSTPVSKP